MRRKLIILTSLITALSAFGAWSAITIGFFGSAHELARRDWLLPGTALIPLSLAVLSAAFVYRHTARRRKTQAIITALLSLGMALLIYFAGWAISPNRLSISRTYEVRRAR